MEEIKYKGYSIKIEQDDNPINPREDDNLGTMICFHRRYDLGDKHDLNKDDFNSWDEVYNYLKKECKAAVILPLYLYDHSGIAISCDSFIGREQHAEWDSGQVGFIYVSKETLKKEKLEKRSKKIIEKYLQGEVETYNQYINGEVYGFIIEDENGNPVEDGSCWGFYDTKDAIAEAKSIVDYEVKQRKEEVPASCLFC